MCACEFIHVCQNFRSPCATTPPAPSHNKPHSPFKEMVLFTYLKKCTFFWFTVLIGWWSFFFFQLCLFFQDFYIVLMTDNKKKSYFRAHLVVHLQTFREIFHFIYCCVLCRLSGHWSCCRLCPSDVRWLQTQAVEVLQAWKYPRDTTRSSAGRPQRLFACSWTVSCSLRLTASAWILHVSYWLLKGVSRGHRWEQTCMCRP